mgnify:CR=1 FL=1
MILILLLNEGGRKLTTQNLLEQANEFIVKINGLMRNIEDFDTVIKEIGNPQIEVCLTDRKAVSYLDSVLSQETLDHIKTSIINTITEEHSKKKQELGLLLGYKANDPVEEKLKVILEEEQTKIENATKEIKPEMTIEDVKRMYHDENKTLKEIADYYGVKKTAVNNFVYRNGLARKYYKNDGFRDKEESP